MSKVPPRDDAVVEHSSDVLLCLRQEAAHFESASIEDSDPESGIRPATVLCQYGIAV